MSIMRLLLLLIITINFLIEKSSSNDDLNFQIQPQLVRINNLDELYITRDDHYIGQVLYHHDQIQLACECQTQLNHIKYHIYWTINNKIYNRFNNSNNITLDINRKIVQIPITNVTCYCIFMPSNLTKIRKYYQYQLYIDLDSEPSLKPIEYVIQTNIYKEHFSNFIQRHLFGIISFIPFIIGITCPLIILNFT